MLGLNQGMDAAEEVEEESDTTVLYKLWLQKQQEKPNRNSRNYPGNEYKSY